MNCMPTAGPVLEYGMQILTRESQEVIDGLTVPMRLPADNIFLASNNRMA